MMLVIIIAMFTLQMYLFIYDVYVFILSKSTMQILLFKMYAI